MMACIWPEEKGEEEKKQVGEEAVQIENRTSTSPEME